MVVTFLIVIYVYISYLVIKNEALDQEIVIIIVVICGTILTFGIFPFPFCRENMVQVFESNCSCCLIISRSDTYTPKDLKPYADTFGVAEEKRQQLLPTTTIDTDIDTDIDIDDEPQSTIRQKSKNGYYSL